MLVRSPPMPSSVIRTFDYDPETRALTVIFVSGRRYRYIDVSEEEVEAMRRAFSKGSYFNRHIRDNYRHVRLG